MRVVGYTKVIPPGAKANNKPQKENHKLDIIKNFITGVREAGDNGLVYDGYEMLDCDVAMMQGFVHDKSAHVPHIQLRRNIASNTRNKWFITADSNLFLYKANFTTVDFTFGFGIKTFEDTSKHLEYFDTMKVKNLYLFIPGKI